MLNPTARRLALPLAVIAAALALGGCTLVLGHGHHGHHHGHCR